MRPVRDSFMFVVLQGLRFRRLVFRIWIVYLSDHFHGSLQLSGCLEGSVLIHAAGIANMLVLKVADKKSH